MFSQSEKIPVSVLIPAKNEESNLPACLESVARADEVFVVDSQSSDRLDRNIYKLWG
jgi:glycosyltransferase involved in cell wall biosynthesis